MSSKRRFVVFSPYADWLVHGQLDAILAKALEVRGCEVLVLRCDAIYGDCPIERGNVDCGRCMEKGDRLFGLFGLAQRPLSAYLAPGAREAAEAWVDAQGLDDLSGLVHEGRPLGLWVASTVLTHFRILPESLTRPDVREAFRRYAVDAILTMQGIEAAARAFGAEAMVVFNARFYPHRAAFEAARALGLPVTVHERGSVAGSFSFFPDRTSVDFSGLVGLVDRWLDVPLTAEELGAAEAVLAGRRQLKLSNYPSFYGASVQGNALDILRIPQGSKVIGVFTSSQDELTITDGLGDVADQFRMLDELFETVRGRDLHLVVRHHPHIGGGGVNIPEGDILTRYYEQAARAPENVRVVMPFERIASASLFPHLVAAIAPFSTISVETASSGIPTAVHAAVPGSRAFHALPSLTGEPLRRFVERAAAGDPSLVPDVRRTYRATYATFHRHSFLLESVRIKNFFEHELRLSSADELLPGRDPVLDRICGHLTDGAPLFPDPPSPPPSTEAEDAFLAALPGRAPPPGPMRLADPLVQVIAVGADPDGWLAASRHRRVGVARLDPAGGDLVARILDAIETGGADYVLLQGPGQSCDASALASAVDALEAPEQAGHAAAAMQGLLLRRARQVIVLERCEGTLEGLVRALDPLRFLGLFVIRRDMARTILERVALSEDPAATLADLYRSPMVYRLTGPVSLVD